MTTCIITYDRHPDNAGNYDYGPLLAELKRLNAQHLQGSVWTIRTVLNPKGLATQIKPLLHPADKLFIAKVDLDGAEIYPTPREPGRKAPLLVICKKAV